MITAAYALAIALIAAGTLGVLVSGALSSERYVITDPSVLAFTGIAGAGVFGLAYLTI